ncbi:hypothetical protein N0B16_00825 [Chryseobacterium sp. GMJ5]|uniref:Uncharacterized protein n=1 Tax=Chryseobacterium gilvum TaxID=2976534 RepID=A0ABT2VSK8_9FLAO|nr:hypothetical protein [Chryseobacterium gilvum]MCU7612972.1 hypothetical protein [Chryseobacterium gilvum]
MMNRFTILKSSWGISIFYEIKELIGVDVKSKDTYEINSSVFISLNCKTIDAISLEYLKAGAKSIIPYLKSFPTTFVIEKLEYNICDYQPEGMYYMFREWFFKSNNMDIPPINVQYDKEANKYLFPDLLIL